MPIMDGYEVMKNIIEKKYELYTIALTAHVLEHEKEKCLKEHNMNDFICKPITLQNIRQTIIKYQQQQRN
jgi:CheY-like chemotaxis protein